jgi:hypothetical protein
MSLFLRKAREIGLSEDEIQAIEVAIAYRPEDGDLIRGTQGVRKRRVALAGRNKGKSGGARVFTVYFQPENPVFIVAIIDKSTQADLSPDETKELAAISTAIKQELRGT